MNPGDPVVNDEMDTVAGYLDMVVEPTFEEFRQNPYSARHVFLACVAVFHSIDRFPGPKNLRRQWRSKSIEFLIIDMLAHPATAYAAEEATSGMDAVCSAALHTSDTFRDFTDAMLIAFYLLHFGSDRLSSAQMQRLRGFPDDCLPLTSCLPSSVG